jgi:hypothetical protein
LTTMDGECCRTERFKYALYSRFKEPRLYRYAVNGNWDLIPRRVTSHPKEAMFQHALGAQDTSLHGILKAPKRDVQCQTQQAVDQVKLQAVSALLSAHRQAASTKNAFGRTPLHLACMDLTNCGEAVAHMILDTNALAASVQDVEGRSPLHYLVARNDDIPLALLTKLISVCPDALEMADSVKETPLEIVSLRGEEIKDAAHIFRVMQTGASGRYSSGPLHVHPTEPSKGIERSTTV